MCKDSFKLHDGAFTQTKNQGVIYILTNKQTVDLHAKKTPPSPSPSLEDKYLHSLLPVLFIVNVLL